MFSKLLQKENFSLQVYAPIFLGIGILVGVFYPLQYLECILYLLILPIILLRFNLFLTAAISFLLITGFYISHTSGILNSTPIVGKHYFTNDVQKIALVADVKYIEHTHPVMKNMKRMLLTNISTKCNYIPQINTMKVTVGARLIKGVEPTDKIFVICNILKTRRPTIPGTFDQVQFNEISGIDANGIILYLKKLNYSTNYDYFSYLRFKIANTISKYISNDACGVLLALSTGDKSAITQEIKECFTKSGTSHILAISGLHMSLIALIIFAIWRTIFAYLKNFYIKINTSTMAAYCTMPFTFLYMMFSGCSPSAIRAFIMTTIVLFAVIKNKRAISINNVAVAAFIILLFNPASLFHVSFQMSFAAVLALISIYSSKMIQKRENTIKIYILTSIVTTIVANLATMPFTIATFNRISLTGLLGNLIAVPITSFLIIPIGLLSIIFHQLLPILELIINLMIEAMRFTANLPYSEIIAKTPNIFSMYSFVVGGIVLCILRTKLRLFGVFPILFSIVSYILQEDPQIIVLPEDNLACIVKDHKIYSNSIKKGRSKFLSIAKNLGINEKPIKCDFQFQNPKCKNTIVQFANGRIMEVTKSENPLCPAFYKQINIAKINIKN